VATQGRRDLQGLKAALGLRPARLWFVASARKAAVLKQSLVASGEDTQQVAAIVAPAGEHIGAQTPEEIALSVLAAVVAARRAPAHATADTAAEPLPSTTVTAQESAASAHSCCGGATKMAAVAMAQAPVAEAPADAPKKSCCGG
ncbi:MAG: XdhC/CoxF family protein, partial [Proteobacteria bacterium]|nr:XdhC/CoxF family protein [Pseudomonadota bacterium]